MFGLAAGEKAGAGKAVRRGPDGTLQPFHPALAAVHAPVEHHEVQSRGQFIAIEFTLNIFGVVVAYWLEL